MLDILVPGPEFAPHTGRNGCSCPALVTLWSLGKRYDSVMFVQSSPNEVLRREIQKIVDDSGFKVRVVERGGRSLKSMLQRSDVEPIMKCFDDDCPICLTAPKGMCQVESVGYRIFCIECKTQGKVAVMDGETGRTGRM